MQTLKTIVVVAVLMGVGFGVHQVLNQKPSEPPPELAGEDPALWSSEPEIEFDAPPPPGGEASPVAAVPAYGGSLSPQPSGSSAGAQAEPSFASGSPAGMTGGSPSSSSPASPSTYAGAQGDSAYEHEHEHGQGHDSHSMQGSSTAEAMASSPAASQYMDGRSTAGISNESSPAVPGAFQAAWRSTQESLGEGDLGGALFTLSQMYGRPELTAQEQSQLINLLDQLAGTVIYSREHHLEPAYEVQNGDTLDQLALQYRVPKEFLARVNGIQPPYTLVPGEKLKVVRGPFRAEIDTQSKEMTLFLQHYYAGRFPVALGSDAQGQQGTFQVAEKSRARTYYGSGGPIAPGAPGNPYGDVWIGLGGNLGLHGSPASGNTEETRGSLRLAPRDAADIFLILANGSQVTIR